MSLTASIREVVLFRELSDAELEAVAAAGATREVEADVVLVEQGASDAGLQIILKGSAHVIVNGEEVRRLGPGDYFGEMSLFDGGVRSATVRSGSQGARTFHVSPATFADLLEEKPGMARRLLAALSARVRELEHGPVPE